MREPIANSYLTFFQDPIRVPSIFFLLGLVDVVGFEPTILSPSFTTKVSSAGKHTGRTRTGYNTMTPLNMDRAKIHISPFDCLVRRTMPLGVSIAEHPEGDYLMGSLRESIRT